MAPFDNPPSDTLTTKISPLIDGQLPDYVRDENPLFSNFLKYYYEYLEAGELIVTSIVDNVLLEVETPSFLLSHDDTQIVYEDSDGKFSVGEIITGQTSKATATILIDDLRNGRMFISAQQQFITGETIVGATSAAEGVITRYRGNPVQNIQQLLAYADVDGTIHDFLDQLSVSFMNAIPKKLAAGIDKRNLFKNIRELYRTKGTSESFKLFIRILLNLDSEIVYPRKFMMRASDGEWSRSEVMRTTPLFSSIGSELVSQKITGLTSGATAVIESSNSLTQGGVNITEFIVSFRDGDFIAGETIRGISVTRDVIQEFTILNIVSAATITNDGILYSAKDTSTINIDFGNGSATAEIESVKTGSVSGVIVDDVGAGFKVGDPLVFASTESNISLPAGFVSVVDGAITLNGTDDISTDAGDFLVYEDATTEHLETFSFELESGLRDEATAIINGSVSNSTTLILDNNIGTITLNMVVYGGGIGEGVTVTAITSQNNITVSSKLTLSDNVAIRFVEAAGVLRTETGNATATDMGHNFISEFLPRPVADTYTTGADQMVLEDATVDLGEITRIHLTNNGNGFKKLPTITLNPNIGTVMLKTTGAYKTISTAALISTTTDIGAIDEILITDGGANYSTTELPDTILQANFVLKDVSGTFVTDAALTTHTGIVKSFDVDTQVLQTTLEDVVRTTLETTDAIPIGLEDSIASTEDYITISGGGTEDGFYDEGFPHDGFADETDNEPFVLNATELTGDAFLALEGDTDGIFRTEPNTFIEKTYLELEDETGVIVGEDAEETSQKFIREFPRGRQPARTWLDKVDFIAGRQISATEFGPSRITPTSFYLDDQSWKDTFGVFVPSLTHKANATAITDGITATENVTLDNNSGTIDEGMVVTGTVATAAVSGSTVNGFNITVIVSGGTIQAGLIVEGTGIPVGTLVATVTSAVIFTLNTQVSLSDSTALTFKLPSNVTVTDVTSQTSIAISSAITFADNTSLSFESASTNGPFIKGEEITGGTSGATALILDPAGDLKFISSNNIDFAIGETITGESKVDSDGNTVTAASVIQTLGQEFILSPESVWTEFDIEVISQKNAPILEDESSAVIFSNESEEIVLETAGRFRNVVIESDHLVLDGTDEILNDDPTVAGFSTVRTNAGGFIVEETSGDIITLESDGDSFITGFSDKSTFDFYDGQNFGLILDGDFDDRGKILLDGTDTDGLNAGSEMIDESSNAGGVASFGVLELEEGGVFLGEIDPETGVFALDGTDSSSTHAGSSVIHEVDGIDFSAGTTVITASGGFTGTIVNADVAKATSVVNFVRDDISGYGNNIESILGEDLNRLQDSFFYQQFSYEIQTGAGANEYINELKKAVHPSGFAVFGKVSIATPLEGPMTLSSLTDAISISAFSGDPDFFRFIRRSLGTMELQAGAQGDVIILEDSESAGEVFSIFEDDGYILEEIGTSNIFESEFVVQLESNDINSGINEKILTEDDFHVSGFSASVVEESFNLILDGTQDGLAFQDSKNAGEDLLDESGFPFRLETALERNTTSRFLVHSVGGNDTALILENGGFFLSETSSTSGSIQPYSRYPVDLPTTHTSLSTGSSLVKNQTNSDVSLIRKMGITLPTESFGNTSHSFGLIRLGENPFGTERTRVETELGTIASKAAQEAHQVAIISISHQDSEFGEAWTGELIMEDSNDGIVINEITKVQSVNLDGVIANTFLLDGTDTSATDRNFNVRLEELNETLLLEDGSADAHVDLTFDGVKLEDGTDGGPGLLLNEASGFSPVLEDIIRRAIIDVGEDPHNTTKSSATVGLLLEESDQGFFKQEDGSTVATTYGDDFLLENTTGYGINDKLIFEAVRMEVETETDKVGVIPHQNYLSSTFDNITHSSDIYIDIGMSIPLEDGVDDEGNGGNIVYDGTDGSSTDAGSNIMHEDGTRASILIDSEFTI